MSRRQRALGADEAELFRESLRDAKPLRRRAAKPAPAPTTVVPPAAREPRVAAPHSAREVRPPPPRAAPLPPIDHGSAPGVDKRTHERFRKGEMPIDGTLDLHGMTQDAAHAALLRFVDRAAQAGHRNLLVVTGKGKRDTAGGGERIGVLRAQVPRWLNQAALRPLLLAIQRARPQHGGDGALYVLLKRKR